MTLLSPIALLFLLSIPAVILFYLLRVRLSEVEVSSTYLWERLLHDLAAQDPWQKPRFTVLMLIQMLLLALLAVALSQPAWLSLGRAGVFQVIVLDASASMQSTDISTTRFNEARRLAAETIRSLPEGSGIAIIAAQGRPIVLVSATEKKGDALAALERAEALAAPRDLASALRLANSIAAGHPRGRVDVFSDGAFDQPEGLPEELVPTRFHLVGGSADNRAIAAISARPDPQNDRRYQVFVRVRNYAPSQVEATLGLYADGNLVDSRNLSLAPDSGQDMILDRLPSEANLVEARLLEVDALAADDSAAIVMERRRPTSILMVTNGNVFLERALLSLPRVELFRSTPGRYPGLDVDKYDLLVFDGYLPDSLPKQNVMLINPPDSPLLPITGAINRPAISTWESENPLLRYVTWSGVAVLRAGAAAAPGWARTLVAADGHPLLLAGERAGQRIVALLFDLQESNLPLAAGFPILVANTVGYLEPAGILSARSLAAGGAVTIQPLGQSEETIVEGPDGRQFRLSGTRALSFSQTDQIGLYTVRQQSRGATISTERFAVNLADEGASDIRPRLSGDVLAASEDTEESKATMPRPLWPWLVLFGLATLLGEWWWYHRRA